MAFVPVISHQPVQYIHNTGVTMMVPLVEPGITVAYPVNRCPNPSPLIQQASLFGLALQPNFVITSSCGINLDANAITDISETRNASQQITELIVNVNVTAVCIRERIGALRANCYVFPSGDQQARASQTTQPVCIPTCTRLVLPFCPPLQRIYAATIFVQFKPCC